MKRSKNFLASKLYNDITRQVTKHLLKEEEIWTIKFCRSRWWRVLFYQTTLQIGRYFMGGTSKMGK